MDQVPVLAGRDRHIGYGKILVQLIKGSRTSTAPVSYTHLDVYKRQPRDCGNYLDMNLPMANYLAKKYLENVLTDIQEDRLVYPE